MAERKILAWFADSGPSTHTQGPVWSQSMPRVPSTSEPPPTRLVPKGQARPLTKAERKRQVQALHGQYPGLDQATAYAIVDGKQTVEGWKAARLAKEELRRQKGEQRLQARTELVTARESSPERTTVDKPEPPQAPTPQEPTPHRVKTLSPKQLAYRARLQEWRERTNELVEEPEPEDLFLLSSGPCELLGLQHRWRGTCVVALRKLNRFDLWGYTPEGETVRLTKIRLLYTFRLEDEEALDRAKSYLLPIKAKNLTPEYIPTKRHPYPKELLEEAFRCPRRLLTATFLDGSQLRGRVTELSRYAFRLEFAPGKFVWAYRHGLVLLELGPPRKA